MRNTRGLVVALAVLLAGVVLYRLLSNGPRSDPAETGTAQAVASTDYADPVSLFGDLAAPPAGLASTFFGRFCESVAPIRPKGRRSSRALVRRQSRASDGQRVSSGCRPQVPLVSDRADDLVLESVDEGEHSSRVFRVALV